MKKYDMRGIPDSLLFLGKERRFLKGSNVFKADERITRIYFIRSGMMKIYIDHENGRRSILDFAGTDDWLGELSLFCREDYIKENKVVADAVCLEYDLGELRQLCKRDAEISFYFASYISNKLMVRSRRLSEYMNISYPHVLFVMRKFCDDGVLQREKGYKIMDFKRLEEIAGSVT